MLEVVYCHGFASSPFSKKATLFREPLQQLGVRYHIPDLNQPDFEHLTLTDMLAHLNATLASFGDNDVVLIGSSMGGLACVHFVDRYRAQMGKQVRKLILLAPAFDFGENRARQMGEQWRDEWRTVGTRDFFNYATGDQRPVHYGMVEDIEQYNSWQVHIDLPILIYHGLHDESVPFEQSQRFAHNRPNVTLHLLDSDHQLLDKTDEILAGIATFLGD